MIFKNISKIRRDYYQLNSLEQQEVVNLYSQGYNILYLKNKFKVGKRQIKNILLDNNIKIKKGNLSLKFRLKNQHNEIIKLITNNESCTTIAKKMKCTRHALARYLKENDVSIQLEWSGPSHPFWKGGSHRNGKGYIVVWVSKDDPYYCMTDVNGYCFEHRYNYAKFVLGRPLEKWEEIHHINGQKDQNNVDNLQLRIKKHGAGICYRCGDCGSYRINPTEISDKPIFNSKTILDEIHDLENAGV